MYANAIPMKWPIARIRLRSDLYDLEGSEGIAEPDAPV